MVIQNAAKDLLMHPYDYVQGSVVQKHEPHPVLSAAHPITTTVTVQPYFLVAAR